MQAPNAAGPRAAAVAVLADPTTASMLPRRVHESVGARAQSAKANDVDALLRRRHSRSRSPRRRRRSPSRSRSRRRGRSAPGGSGSRSPPNRSDDKRDKGDKGTHNYGENSISNHNSNNSNSNHSGDVRNGSADSAQLQILALDVTDVIPAQPVPGFGRTALPTSSRNCF